MRNIPILTIALKSGPPQPKSWVILREVLIASALLFAFMSVGNPFQRLTLEKRESRFARLNVDFTPTGR